MNEKKAKALRKQLREQGVAVGGSGRKAYRMAKRDARPLIPNIAKPLAPTHSHRTAEARAHAALPKDERNEPWRVGAPLISAKHPQRARRSGRKTGNRMNMTPPEMQLALRLQGFGKFAGAFLSGAMGALAGIAGRYQKRAARGQ
ncbi:hypothetical protein [Trinickia mobilis]|uniref:hypothetical protein n=1 Tax=Trinickia mobilis TaxID=2816356 RepID=UPI001A8C6A85|nr:hypothetical protein [Trinickia mobilis]